MVIYFAASSLVVILKPKNGTQPPATAEGLPVVSSSCAFLLGKDRVTESIPRMKATLCSSPLFLRLVPSACRCAHALWSVISPSPPSSDPSSQVSRHPACHWSELSGTLPPVSCHVCPPVPSGAVGVHAGTTWRLP